MQTNPWAMGHLNTAMCREGGEQQAQYKRAAELVIALRQQFSAYWDPLKRVEVFKYLGWLMTMEDDDGLAINANLRKGRRSWARLSRVLRSENAAPLRVCHILPCHGPLGPTLRI